MAVRTLFLWRATAYSLARHRLPALRIQNHGDSQLEVGLTLRFASDFADLVEVRGLRRQRRGPATAGISGDPGVTPNYQDLDGNRRRTMLQFVPVPQRLFTSTASYAVVCSPFPHPALIFPVRTIAHISDLHFGRHSLKLAEDLLTSVNHVRPDLVALSGDFTQHARHAEFAEARRFLDRISQPKLVVPGNHDVPFYNVFDRFLTPFEKYDHYVMPVGQAAGFFRDDELAVLALNTARRFTLKNGCISLEQIAHIRRVFRDVSKDIFKALVTHHPLGIPSGEGPLELVGRSHLAVEAIADVGVHLLLSGHHHRSLTGSMTGIGGGRSILVLHAGTAISTRTRGAEGNTYNVIHITKERVTVRVMEWMEGHGFHESRIMSYALQERRWQFV